MSVPIPVISSVRDIMLCVYMSVELSRHHSIFIRRHKCPSNSLPTPSNPPPPPNNAKSTRPNSVMAVERWGNASSVITIVNIGVSIVFLGDIAIESRFKLP